MGLALSHLKILNAHHNELTALPRRLGSMTALTNIMMSHNQLTFLPHGMGNLQNLEGLWLEENELTAIDEAIASLPKLRFLKIKGNPLSSTKTAVHRFVAKKNAAAYVDPSQHVTRQRTWLDYFTS